MVAFGDLSSAAGLTQLNEYLKTRSYIEGYSFSDADRNTFAQVGAVPDAGAYPYAYRWGLHIAALLGARALSRPAARAPAAAVAAPAASAASPAPAPASSKKNKKNKKEENKEAAPVVVEEKKAESAEQKGGDDDFDVFGDDDEKPAAKSNLAAKAAALKESKKDNKKAERSQIVFEVKPADESTNLEEVWRTITAMEIEGLTWGQGFELKPVAYGIQKLVMSCVIIDDLVLLDDIFGPIEAMEETVQSVDMLTMNRL